MNYAELAYNFERQPQLKGMQNGDRLKLLTETVVSIKTDLFKRNVSSFLPDKISLLEGFILLLALNDEISVAKTGKPLDKLKRIRSMVFLRNNSIFAHGLGPVSETDFKKFRSFVLDMFREFCVIEGIDFEQYAHDMEWLNPLHSKNYAGMEVSELWQ